MASPYETYLRRYLNDDGRLWTSDQIARWSLRAEQEICRVHPAVFNRSQIPIQQGLPLYTIPPDNAANIPSLGVSQITYKGEVLIPLSLQQAHDLFPLSIIDDPSSLAAGAFNPAAFQNDAFYVFSATSAVAQGLEQGVPTYWWYAGYNENEIQLYPTPNETIAYDNTATNLWNNSDSIRDLCVVEYKTFSFSTFQPLGRLVRQLIKDYVLSIAFGIEGKGQQMRESIMLKKRFESRLNLYRALASNVFVENKHSFRSQTMSSFVPFRRLNYGSDIGVRVRG